MHKSQELILFKIMMKKIESWSMAVSNMEVMIENQEIIQLKFIARV